MSPIDNSSNWQKHTSKNPVQKLLIKLFYDQLFNTVKHLNIVSVLDVGCGEGFTLNKLKIKYPHLKLAGVDLSPQAITLAQKSGQDIDYKTGDIYRLPYADNQFDLVISTEVLEHLQQPKKAVKEIMRVSNRYCLFSVPHEPWFKIANFLRGKYLSAWGNHPEHVNHWTKTGFSKFLESSRLTIIATKLSFPWIIVLTLSESA